MQPKLPFDSKELIQQYHPDFCAAYGSGVFPQPGYTRNEHPLIDLIFAVDNPAEWHKENLHQHLSDYSLLMKALSATPLFGPLINYIHDTLPDIYYNTGIKFGDAKIKYGIIPISELERDLKEWTTLYMAGRLQKPVRHIVDNPGITKAMQINLRHAVNVAILLCDNKVTDYDFFSTIANISYLGDWRMQVAGDHPRKAQNIVAKNPQGFWDLYESTIKKSGITITPLPDAHDLFTTHRKPERIEQIVSELPENLRQRLSRDIHEKSKEEIQKELLDGIRQISYEPSMRMAFRGIITYGFLPSIGYAARKVGKGIKGRYLERE